MPQYLIPELPEGFDEPPAYPVSSRPRPGGDTTGAGMGSAGWRTPQTAVAPQQTGGLIGAGGGPFPEVSSWLPTSMLKRGL